MHRRSPITWALSIAVAVAATVAASTAAAERIEVAVVPLAAKRIDAAKVEILDELLLGEIHALGAYQAIGRSDISTMIGFDRLKAAVGCNDVSCAADIGGALGVELLVGGSVSVLGRELIISLRLIDIRRTEIVNRAQVEVADAESQYVGALKRAVQQLFVEASAIVSQDARADRAVDGSAGPTGDLTEYDRGYLWLPDLRRMEVYQGRQKLPLEASMFYRRVGRADLAETYEDGVVTRRLWYASAAVPLAAGLGVIIWALVAPPGHTQPVCTLHSSDECWGWSSENEWTLPLSLIGAGVALLSVIPLAIGAAYEAQPVDPAGAQFLADQYNDQLRERIQSGD